MADTSSNMTSKNKPRSSNWADQMNASSSDSQDSEDDPMMHTPESESESPLQLTQFERLAHSRETSNTDDPGSESSSSSEYDSSLAPTITEEGVRKLADKHATSIFSDWAQLKVVVEGYGDKLRKRWESKTKGDKANILLKAWPNMSFSHRPDFHAFLNQDCGQKVQGKTKFKDAYMWPQINLEDLTYGRTLLLYIDARGRHPPQTFVYADWAACFLGRRSNSIAPSPLLKSYTMFLDGKTPTRYGRIVAWHKDAKAKNQLITGNGFLTVKGLMILEIQQRIMNFLVQCCLILLGDLTTSFLNAVSTRSFDTANKTKLNVIAAEAPYRAPVSSDFERLKTIILTRRTMAEDHVCALRTLPGYFSDALMQKKQHRYEMLLDESGAHHPGIDSPKFWDGVISGVMLHAYGELWCWDYAFQQITNVLSLKEKYSTEISPKKQLPEEYMLALLVLKETLTAMESQTGQELQRLFPPSPAYRHMFSRLSLDPTTGLVRGHEEVKTDVIMGFFEIITDFSKLRLFNPLDLTDELERAIEAQPKLKSMLSPLIARLVADLGILGRALHELKIYQPWASGIEFLDKKHIEEAGKVLRAEVGSKDSLLCDLANLSLSDVGKPLDGQFHYPSDEPRTDITTKQMKESKRKLGVFWNAFKRQYTENTNVGFHERLEYLILKKPDAAPKKEDAQEKIKVGARALKVCKKLFYSGLASDPVADTDWKELVHAMSVMGFEVEKLHGVFSSRL